MVAAQHDDIFLSLMGLHPLQHLQGAGAAVDVVAQENEQVTFRGEVKLLIEGHEHIPFAVNISDG